MDSHDSAIHPNEPQKSLSVLESNSQSHFNQSDRPMEIHGLADLSLFRSHSMPIPSFAETDDSFQGSQLEEDRNQDEDDEEDDTDDIDDIDVLATPPFVLPATNDSLHASRLFSCSLPPSLDRRKTLNNAPHENALCEFFQLTQPMREGVISRERLLPSSRMKQVGIGGRGRRAPSNHKMIQNVSSPTGEFIRNEQDHNQLPSPVKLDHTLTSPGSSSFTHQQYNLNSSIGSASSVVVNSQFAQVPLIRPRPILAWDHRRHQILEPPVPVSKPTEAHYQAIK